jgi:hypothetical protein
MATPTTLPASFTAGAVLTAAQMNDLRGAFRVLQVVNATTGTSVNTATATFVDSTLTATITPTSTSSKILVMVTQSVGKTSASSFTSVGLKIVRNSTDIFTITTTDLYTGTLTELYTSTSANYLDSPATTSATTYKTQFNSPNAQASSYVQPFTLSKSTITLLEISA